MLNYTETANGAPSLKSPDISEEYDGRLKILFKATRGITDSNLIEYLNKASSEDIIETFIICFYTRDIRGGKGERCIGRKMFGWLSKNHPDKFIKVVDLISEYGRWDDILFFLQDTPDYEIKQTVLHLIKNQLQDDRENMLKGKPISLCAKWMPTENDSKDKKYHLVKEIRNYMSITKDVYRKIYLTPLRAYLKIVEKYMCAGRWNEIDFSSVPSCAMQRLKKAFEKHTPELFKEWKEKLKKNEVKVNAKVLLPHLLVKEMRLGKSDEVTYEQWKVIEEEVKTLGILEKAIAVVDTSGSMMSGDCLPFDIACAMGLIISSVSSEPFKDQVMTFSEEPHFHSVKGDDILSKYKRITKSDIGYSTNVISIFKHILTVAERHKLKQEDMPTKIFIISDMQFNDIEHKGVNKKTTFEYIDSLYQDKKYKRPNIVFWNVNGSSEDFPVSVDDYGTCMISGASPYILSHILKVAELSSVNILKEIVNDKRYDIIRQKLI